MEKSALAIATFLGLLIGHVSAQERANSPAGPPPQFRTVSAYDERLNSVKLTEERWTRKTASVEGAPEVEGEVKSARKAAHTYECISFETTISLDFADAVDVSGKKLSRNDLARRLTTGAVVVVSSDGQPLAPPHLKTLSSDTVIVVSPRYAYRHISAYPVGRILLSGNLDQTPRK